MKNRYTKKDEMVIIDCENIFAKCILSIMQQTYHNIQIILVDDGSTDGFEIIRDDFAKVGNRVEFIHKQNEGLSVQEKLA